MRQYDNGAVRVKLLWIGRVVSPHLRLFDTFKVFELEVMNYTSDGTLAPDPIDGGQTFSREDAAVKAYEGILTKWTDFRVDEDGDFMETGDQMEAPKSSNPNTPESVPDAPERGGIGAGDDPLLGEQADQHRRPAHAQGRLFGAGPEESQRIKSPDGKLTLAIPSSPSDWRSELNWISQARNIGVDRGLLV